MVTVCIFFGSGGGPGGVAAALTGGPGCAGAIATGAAIAGEEGQSGLAKGAPTGTAEPGIGATEATTDGGKATPTSLIEPRPNFYRPSRFRQALMSLQAKSLSLWDKFVAIVQSRGRVTPRNQRDFAISLVEDWDRVVH